MTLLARVAAGLTTSVLIALVLPASVWAQPRAYVVAVAESHEASGISASVGRAARRALRGSRTDWVEPDARFLGYDAEVWASFREAMGASAEGSEAYVDLDLDTAIAKFELAVASFDAASSSLEDVEPFADALFRLATAQTAAGHLRAARATLLRLHVQFPDFEPDEDEFNPTAVSAFRDAAPSDANNPNSTIDVVSEPPGALVFVDHVAIGNTPCAASGLLGGTHIVRVVRPGAPAVVREVNVRRNGRASVSLAIEAGADTEALEGALSDIRAGGDGIAEGAESLAGILAVERLSVFRASDDGSVSHGMYTNAQGYREAEVISGADLVRDVYVATRDDLAIAGAPNTQVGDGESPFLSTGGVPERPTRDSRPGPAFYETWYFWAGVGVLAVAGGILAIVLLTDSPDESNFGQVVLEF